MTRFVLAALLTLSVAGCGKDKDKDKGGGGQDEAAGTQAAKGGGAAADPKAWKPFKMEDLGVVVDAPGDAKKSALGGISATSEGWYCNVDLHAVGEKPQTYENFLHNIENGNIGGAIKEMRKKEKTDDNTFIIDFIGERKSGYYHRQKIGDKVIQCGGNGEKESSYNCIKKVCESLKAI